MGCGASHERAEPAGLVPVVPTAASTPVAASEKAEKAAAENLVAEADEAVAAIAEEAKAENLVEPPVVAEADEAVAAIVEEAMRFRRCVFRVRTHSYFFLTTRFYYFILRVFSFSFFESFFVWTTVVQA